MTAGSTMIAPAAFRSSSAFMNTAMTSSSAEACEAEVAGHGGGRPAARSRGHAIQRVRILRVALNRTQRFVRTEGELRHVRLREHDRAGVFDLLDQESVPIGDEAFERSGSVR